MPMTIIEIPSHSDNLSTAPEVVPQPQRSLDQLQLEEVIRPPIVGIQHQPVGLVGLELQLEAAIGGCVPLPELRVRVLAAVEHEGAAAARQQRDGHEPAPHVGGSRN